MRALYERPADAAGLEDSWRTDRATAILAGSPAGPAQMGTQAAPPAQLATPATPGVTAADLSGALGGIIKVDVQHSGTPAPGTTVGVSSPSDNIQVRPGVAQSGVGSALP